MIQLKPGLYRLTKSFKNPHLEKVSHRDLMGVLRALPAGWDWLVYRFDRRLDNSPLMVIAACGGGCQAMFVYEEDYQAAMADWDEEEDDSHPLLAPPEFLEALEPSELDTYKRVRYAHKHTLPDRDTLKFDETMRRLLDTGKLSTKDLDEAMTWVEKNQDTLQEMAPEIDEDQLYSDAVNEVFNETGEHWID